MDAGIAGQLAILRRGLTANVTLPVVNERCAFSVMWGGSGSTRLAAPIAD